jgi:hypothetical protein
MDFVKLGFGTVMGLELWEKFVDFLIKQWRKAAAEARERIAAGKEVVVDEPVDPEPPVVTPTPSGSTASSGPAARP